MPKEQITYGREFVIHNDDGRSQIVFSPSPDEVRDGERVFFEEAVAAHWSKGPGGVAQLSFTFDVETVRECVKSYDEHPEFRHAGEGLIAFYTKGLDRNELQRLIRVGRKMRDDVHEPDE